MYVSQFLQEEVTYFAAKFPFKSAINYLTSSSQTQMESFIIVLLLNTYSEKYGNQCMDENLFSLFQILPDFLLVHLLEIGSRVKYTVSKSYRENCNWVQLQSVDVLCM